MSNTAEESDMATSEEECPVCRDKIRDSSQPTRCCGKVICQSCLSHCLLYRAHCPHCRGQINSPDSNLLRPDRRRSVRRTVRRRVTGIFSARRPVDTNTQTILGQLQVAQSQQTNTANQTSLPDQNAPTPVPQRLAPSLLNSAAVPPSWRYGVPTPSPALVAQLNPIPAQHNLEAELDEWPWQTEITLMETRQQQQGAVQGSMVRTYACPLCQNDGFDQMGLRDHCNAEHASDRRPVVCPVCVALPHGDPTYISRNFIGHLNMRHSFYTENVTNVTQSDEMNIQYALMASFAKNS